MENGIQRNLFNCVNCAATQSPLISNQCLTCKTDLADSNFPKPRESAANNELNISGFCDENNDKCSHTAASETLTTCINDVFNQSSFTGKALLSFLTAGHGNDVYAHNFVRKLCNYFLNIGVLCVESNHPFDASAEKCYFAKSQAPLAPEFDVEKLYSWKKSINKNFLPDLPKHHNHPNSKCNPASNASQFYVKPSYQFNDPTVVFVPRSRSTHHNIHINKTVQFSQNNKVPKMQRPLSSQNDMNNDEFIQNDVDNKIHFPLKNDADENSCVYDDNQQDNFANNRVSEIETSLSAVKLIKEHKSCLNDSIKTKPCVEDSIDGIAKSFAHENANFVPGSTQECNISVCIPNVVCTVSSFSVSVPNSSRTNNHSNILTQPQLLESFLQQSAFDFSNKITSTSTSSNIATNVTSFSSLVNENVSLASVLYSTSQSCTVPDSSPIQTDVPFSSSISLTASKPASTTSSTLCKLSDLPPGGNSPSQQSLSSTPSLSSTIISYVPPPPPPPPPPAPSANACGVPPPPPPPPPPPAPSANACGAPPPPPPPPPPPAPANACGVSPPPAPPRHIIKSNKILKPLYWTKVCLNNTTSNTNLVWKHVQAPIINENELEELFCKQNTVRKKSTKPKKHTQRNKMQTVKILETKRSQAVAIFMSSLHIGIEDVKNAILNVDTKVVDIETMEAIYDLRPQEKELEKILAHVKNQSNLPFEKKRVLDKPEEFLYRLWEVPLFTDRIFCITFTEHFRSDMHEVTNTIEIIDQTCISLVSDDVIMLLGIILSIGNVLNRGNRSRGSADGFKLDILSKLKDVKSNSGLNLLSFIARTYISSKSDEENVLSVKCPVPSALDIIRSSHVKFDEIQKDIKKIKKNLNDCEKKALKILSSCEIESTTVFRTFIESFLVDAFSSIASLQKKLLDSQANFESTAMYFGVRENSGNLAKEFFGLWTSFCTDLHAIWPLQLREIIDASKKSVNTKLDKKRLSITSSISKTRPKPNSLKSRLENCTLEQ